MSTDAQPPTESRTAGRPTKRTPDRGVRFLKALRDGNTRKNAAALAGWSEDTLGRELKNNADFADSVLLAEAAAESFYVAALKRGTRTSWSAALAWLERRRSQDWGKVDRVEVTIRREAERIADELGLNVEDVLHEAERIAARRA